MARRKLPKKSSPVVGSTKPPKVVADQVMALCQQAEAFYNAEKIELALPLVQHAIQSLQPYKKAHPQNVYFLLARCYHSLGQQDKAVAAIEQEIALNPQNERARYFANVLKNSKGHVS